MGSNPILATNFCSSVPHHRFEDDCEIGKLNDIKREWRSYQAFGVSSDGLGTLRFSVFIFSLYWDRKLRHVFALPLLLPHQVPSISFEKFTLPCLFSSKTPV